MMAFPVHRVRVCNPPGLSRAAAPGEVIVSSSGVLDQTGYHGADEPFCAGVQLPSGSKVYVGTYGEVLKGVASARSGENRDNCVGIILARRNEPELEEFLSALRGSNGDHGIASWMGGVAAPASAGEDDPEGMIFVGGLDPSFPAEDVAVLIVPGGNARPVNIHDVVHPAVWIEGGVREVRAIDGSDPMRVLMDVAEAVGCPRDLEHVTLATGDGRNVHLSVGDDRLVSGAGLPDGVADVRAVVSIAESLDHVLVGHDLAFSCAGLGGALERTLSGRSGVVAWMYGEIVDFGVGPELGNLMISIGDFGISGMTGQ